MYSYMDLLFIYTVAIEIHLSYLDITS